MMGIPFVEGRASLSSQRRELKKYVSFVAQWSFLAWRKETVLVTATQSRAFAEDLGFHPRGERLFVA